MQTILFHTTIFGPVKSRRLGVSLGVNLMPNDGKICSFDCLYCEAGFNAQGGGHDGLPSRQTVRKSLNQRLKAMKEAGEPLDSITFSGNGEPTLHPQFKEIVDDVLMLRNRYYPEAKVTVLSNGSMAERPAVAEALKAVDNNVLKLDSAIAGTMLLLNRPTAKNILPVTIEAVMADFHGHCIVQTMLVRGQFNGQTIDNTTDKEVDALIKAYNHIRPQSIMLYTTDRPTAAEGQWHVDLQTLNTIADRIRKETGIATSVAD